nr:hypothetical protein Iba_chr12dCG1370 [Ipomoea batatas]
MHRMLRYIIRTAFPYHFCSSFNGEGVLDFLDNFRDGGPHAPVGLHAHQRFLGYLPHGLDVVLILQGGVDDALNIPALDVQFCLDPMQANNVKQCAASVAVPSKDHGTGKHGSPPSCAHSNDAKREMKPAITGPVTHGSQQQPHIIRTLGLEYKKADL